MMNIDINKDIMSMLGTRFIENKHNIDTNIDNLSMIFMKRLDDLEAKRERDADFTGEKYVSRFAGKFTVPGSNESIDKNELRWSVLNISLPMKCCCMFK